MKTATWCAGLALAAASFLWAADPPPKGDAPKPDAPKTVSDQEFVQTATAAYLAEINLGRLAAEHASGAEVKKFGQEMVDDHSKGLDDLNKAADAARIAPAQTMEPKARDLYTKLVGMKGVDFDEAYLTAQVDGHKAAVGLFEAESKSGKNDDLKAVAGKQLPMIQHHLEMAQKLVGQEKKPEPEKAPPPKDKPAPEKDKPAPPKDKPVPPVDK